MLRDPLRCVINTVTLWAMWKPTVMGFEDAYAAAGKQKYNGYYKMQDMTSEICNNVTVPSEQSTTTLIDVRDNNTYTVAKLLDDKCWMTQNLNIGRDKEITLYEKDSDLVGTFYLPKSTNQFKTENSTSYIYYNASDSTDRVYYNWYAATAGTGVLSSPNVTNHSICSKGFKLPHPNDFLTLFSFYKRDNNLFNPPSNFKGYGGIRYNDNFEINDAEYWTSGLETPNNPSRTFVADNYYFYSNTGVVTWNGVGGSANGPASYSVRCLAR